MSRKSRIRLVFLLAAFTLVIGVVERSLVSGIRAVVQYASGRIIPIYCVDRTDKKVAISFDATWGADTTPGLLELLRENHVKTTFFLAGYWLEKYPEMVKRISDEGHELGNHTYSHPHCNSLSPEELTHELEETSNLIKNITEQRDILFRPPFGEYNNTVITTAKSQGYETIMWDVDSLDWKDLSADEIYRRVMSRVKPGSIVLFHNAGKHTQEAVSSIIKELKAQDYKIVPISKLLLDGETYVDHAGRQKCKDVSNVSTDVDNPAVFVSSSWSSSKWSNDEGGPGFDAVSAVVAQGISKVVTEAGYTAWYRGNPDKNNMALAINVAWGEEYLPSILKTLKEADVKATFYFVGSWVKMFPEMTKAIADEGHEIANHGYQHSHPTTLDNVALENMIALNRELLRETTGREPSKLFSPPYGEIDDRVIDAAGRLGMVSTMWTLDTIDWQRPPAKVIVDRIVGKATNGAIVLMHPTSPTSEALPELINQLKDKGYHLVPVSQVI